MTEKTLPECRLASLVDDLDGRIADLSLCPRCQGTGMTSRQRFDNALGRYYFDWVSCSCRRKARP